MVTLSKQDLCKMRQAGVGHLDDIGQAGVGHLGDMRQAGVGLLGEIQELHLGYTNQDGHFCDTWET